MFEENAVYVLLAVFFSTAALCQLSLYIIYRYRWVMVMLERHLENEKILQITTSIDVFSMACLWYTISLSFTIFNKWFMQEWKGGFNFPIFITSVHMSMKFLISRIWSCSPTVEKIEPISWITLFTIVVPIGMLTAMDIVLTNAAILFLPLSTVTTVKGSSLIFTFFWGIVLKLEIFRWNLFTAVIGITVGLAIAVTNSFAFNTLGIVLAFSSALSSGLRWALMQFLATKDHQSKSVMVTLYRFSPASVMTILPCLLFLETKPIAESHFTIHMKDFYDACLLSTFGGLIAFILIVVEVKLVRLTSSLTLNVLGQIKEMIQIGLAMILFNENLTLKGMLGILLSILSSLYYRYIIISIRSEKDGGAPSSSSSTAMMASGSSSTASMTSSLTSSTTSLRTMNTAISLSSSSSHKASHKSSSNDLQGMYYKEQELALLGSTMMDET